MDGFNPEYKLERWEARGFLRKVQGPTCLEGRLSSDLYRGMWRFLLADERLSYDVATRTYVTEFFLLLVRKQKFLMKGIRDKGIRDNVIQKPEKEKYETLIWAMLEIGTKLGMEWSLS
tara:strand:- start:18 stop:371 length:354 start_codon:yes stop_codon:yes gene_type:complete